MSNKRNTDKCEGIVGVSFELESVFILLNSVSVGKHVALKVQLQAILGGFESLCPQCSVYSGEIDIIACLLV